MSEHVTPEQRARIILNDGPLTFGFNDWNRYKDSIAAAIRSAENAAYDRAANAISAEMSRYNDEGTERGLSWAAEVVSNLKHKE